MPSSTPFLPTLREWIEVFMRRSMRNFILYSKQQGLTMSQIGALFHLQRNGACGVSDIADHLGVSNAAASQLLERLVQQDMVTRSEAPHDRRVKQITLTEKGRQALDESVQARQRWLEDLAHSLTQAEKEQLVAALKILIEKAKLLHVSSTNLPEG